MDTNVKIITVTEEHWNKALAEAPECLQRKGRTPDYCRKCVVGQALTAAGFNVEVVGHKHFRDVAGNRYKMNKAGEALVDAFDAAETSQRLGYPIAKPIFPIFIYATPVTSESER